MKYNNLIDEMIKAGFTRESATEQLVQLGKIIDAAILGKIIQENPEMKVSEDNIRKIISTKYSSDVKKEEIVRVAADEAEGYLEAITRGMAPQAKQKLMDSLVAEKS